ncbi:MAG: PASTA domain-containing protein [Clostridiales bacterium]|nr:PASTA domain-containing protein [Candidatus Apopatousia equi]
MNNQHTTLSVQKRLSATIIAIVSLFLLLFSRLAVLQVISAKKLQTLAEEQWTRDLPISASRGIIYDRNNEVLAVSYTSFDVFVRASNVVEPEKVALVLSQKLGVDYESTLKKAKNKNISESLIKLSVEKEKAEEIRSQNLKGIYFSENTKRYYPYGDLLTQVLGYTTIDNIGQSGLELYYDKYLKGIDGYSLVQSDIRGSEIDNTLESYVSSIQGCDITLTIDVKIQQLCERAAEQIMIDHKPTSASVIVMQPDTGEILAMTSKPSFSLNEIPRDDVSSLMKNSKNLSIVDVYEPGSTFKVLTTAAALEEKVTSLNDRFYDPGYRIVDGQKIKCWRSHGHGSQTMVDGLCNSCNSVFVDLSLRMGEDRMYSYFEKYGFGSITNVDFPGESAGILMDRDNTQKVDLARMGFGQAIAVTPLQLITAECSVFNGGTLMQPYFVSKISNNYNNYIKTFSPTKVRQTVSKQTSDDMNYMMEQVIKKANAINAFIPGYRVGGKTGTTELFSEKGKIQGEFISSFLGTFPADKPEYVILVVVDRPTSGAYYGSIVATPYAKQVFEGIIEYKNIAPTEDIVMQTSAMALNIEMPNLVGKSLSQAIKEITYLGLQYESDGEGGIITKQYPSAGTMMFKNGICYISTE